MKRIALVCCSLLMATAAVERPSTGANEFPTAGPDLIVGDLFSTVRWGREGQVTAFSVGTVHCNAGDTNVSWVAFTNQHPVIAQHMYRLKDGRFEMIGQSWVTHGLTALAQSFCSSLLGYSCNGQAGSVLGVGCSDVHSASFNGSHQWLGSKHEVNAATGSFPYPFSPFPDDPPIRKRLQVHDDDLRPELNGGATYFLEAHYIAPDDAMAGNGLNNASYRRVSVTETAPDEFNLSWIAGHTTQRFVPAIYAWQEIDPSVTITKFDVPDDGRFILGYNVTDNGDNTWSYEFALHNFNSDRSGGSFSLPVPQGVSVTDVDFHNVRWHSGAPYDESPWAVSHEDGMLTWQTQTFDENPDANALRWGTLYNFRFIADAPPTAGEVVLGLFKPGQGDAPNAAVFAAVRPRILGDLNDDGVVNVSDLLALLSAWGDCPRAMPCPADLNGDGVVNVTDLLMLLGNWG